MRIQVTLLATVFLLAAPTYAQPAPPSHTAATPKFSRPEVKEELSTVAACLGHGEIDTNKLTKNEVAILDEIIAGREPRFSDVTAAWLAAEVIRFNALRGTNLTEVQVQDILRAATANSRPGVWTGLKNQVTERTAARLKVPEFYFNETYSNPLDVILSGKSQSSGFTSFLHLAARFSWGEEPYRKQRPAVVFTQGHALPALVKKEAGKDFLMGIETTVGGAGSRPFGDVALLATAAETVRLIDGEMFALLQVFGDRLPKTIRECWTEAALRDTAQRYGFDRSAIEKRIAKTVPAGAVKDLWFGQIEVPSGDLRRVKVDTIDATTVIAPTPLVATPAKLPLAAPTHRPAPVAATPTAEAMLKFLQADPNDSAIKRMNPAAMQAELAGLEKKSLAAWRVNKEMRNEETGLSVADLNALGLTTETTQRLTAYLNARTEACVTVEAKKASAAVYEARQNVQKVGGPLLRQWTAKTQESIFNGASFAGRTQALKAAPEERKAVLETAMDDALAEAQVEEAARKALLPPLVELELRRFESDTAWRRVFFPGLTDSLPAGPPKKR